MAEPIPCRPVTVDKGEIERVLASTTAIKEFTLRLRMDGGVPEALVFVDEQSGPMADDIEGAISARLPGYCIPDLHRLLRPLSARNEEFDFDELKKEIARQHSTTLSEHGKLVAEIVGNLLCMDPADIFGDSDFFLLGGSSLLLGQLSYNIRKQTGMEVGIAMLFRNSTIQDIASLIDEAKARSRTTDPLSARMSPVGSEETLRDDGDQHPIGGRSETNPLCMMIQAIPLLFFHPIIVALSCMYP